MPVSTSRPSTAWWPFDARAAGAMEYTSRGIRVNAVLPGIIRTPMIARLS